RSYATFHTFVAEVTDGLLRIKASASAGETMINGISIIQVTEDQIAPARPTETIVTGGFDRMIVNWDPNYEADLTGFNIYRKLAAEEFIKLNAEPLLYTMYIDDDVEVGVEYFYTMTSVDIWGNESEFCTEISGIAVGDEASQLPIYELTVTQANLDKLNEDYLSDDYVDCEFKYGGKTWSNVKIRYRGRTTRGYRKKNYKIKFDSEDLFDNMRSLNLTSEMGDLSLIKDLSIYEAKKLAGLPTHNVYPLHLKLNGEFIGVYVQREQEDDAFVSRLELGSGNLYKPLYRAYSNLETLDDFKKDYSKETNPNSGFQDIISLTRFVNETPDAELFEELPRRFHIDEFFTSFAVLNLFADLDHSWGNFYLFRSFEDNKWREIHFDHDYSLHNYNYPFRLYTKEARAAGLYHWILNKLYYSDDYRWYYCHKYDELLNGALREDSVETMMKQFFADVKFDAHRDIYKNSHEDNVSFDNYLFSILSNVRKRAALIRDSIAVESPAGYDPLYRLFVNEIMPDNDKAHKSSDELYHPWIEIYNDNVIPVDVSACKIQIDSGEMWTIPAGSIVDPKGHIIIYTDCPAEQGGLFSDLTMPEEASAITLYYPDAVEICAEMDFDIPDTDQSYGRKEDGSAELITFNQASPNKQNFTEPGNSLRGIVFINEIMPANTQTVANSDGEFEDWIELYNAGVDIDMSGYWLSDNRDAPFKWQFPKGYYLKSKSTTKFFADGLGADNTNNLNFKLSRSGEEVLLTSPDGLETIDYIKFPECADDVSYGRNGDGSHEWISFAAATPGKSNIPKTVDGKIYINEFMAKNSETILDENGNAGDWIELYNPDSVDRDIGGWFLTDSDNNLSKWQIPVGSLIEAFSFLLIWADGDPEAGEFHANFKLGGTGEQVLLVGPDGATIIDSLSFGVQEDDISYGRFIDAGAEWMFFEEPTPGATNNVYDENDELVEILSISPNPTEDVAYIEYKTLTAGPVRLFIFDNSGRKVFEKLYDQLQVGEHAEKIDVSALSIGNYYYIVKVGSTIKMKMFAKMK
ncbi:MAG: lamin tail domain-containing protein, partial [Candidatus Kapabacteria bacterium]|nr:lamin tail domain-containing protein [Candidatus Kapabacteria bacterium]